MPTNEFKTIGQIALERGIGRHRVQYLIETRRIDPVMIAAGARLYGPEQIAAIVRALDEIDGQRHSPHLADVEYRGQRVR